MEPDAPDPAPPAPDPPPPPRHIDWAVPPAPTAGHPLDRDVFDASRLRGGPLRLLLVVDALLKEPGSVYRRIWNGQDAGLFAGSIFFMSLAFSVVYGALMGSFGGPTQALYAAIKFPLVLLGSMAICLPSFYVFSSILGSKLSIRQTTLLVLCITGPTATLLMGFAPIAWFFTISTESGPFMAGLHIVMVGIATTFGVGSLQRARHYLLHLSGNRAEAGLGLLAVWVIVYLAVLCQMSTYLRPLLAPGPFFTGEKELFLSVLFGG